MKESDKHLSDLYEAYRPDMAGMPTPDALLSGVAVLAGSVGFDAKYQLGIDMVDELAKIWNKHGKKTNILVDAKLVRFFDFLAVLEPELQVVLIRKILDQGIDVSKYDDYRRLNEQFGEFFT